MNTPPARRQIFLSWPLLAQQLNMILLREQIVADYYNTWGFRGMTACLSLDFKTIRNIVAEVLRFQGNLWLLEMTFCDFKI
jgi:hypothetical protein